LPVDVKDEGVAAVLANEHAESAEVGSRLHFSQSLTVEECYCGFQERQARLLRRHKEPVPAHHRHEQLGRGECASVHTISEEKTDKKNEASAEDAFGVDCFDSFLDSALAEKADAVRLRRRCLRKAISLYPVTKLKH
jgi:hypothetical protein